MPFIDCKISRRLTEEEKELLKTELGTAVSILRKSEGYLMVGIDDGYDLYMAGSKLVHGAYVSVSLFGSAATNAFEKMTAAVCDILENNLAIPASSVYVTYHPVDDWGWNGENF